MTDRNELVADLKDAYDTRDGYLAGLCGDAAEEIERLHTALREISELPDVRSDEASTIASRALKRR